MVLRVGINGFGRIGRAVTRIAATIPEIEVVAVNDLVDPENLAYLLKYDSVHGTFDARCSESTIETSRGHIEVLSEKDPAQLPWADKEIDFVIDSTGLFLNEEGANKHLQAGAKKVVISAPAKGEIPTFVMGVNHETYDPKVHHIVSNASCTTNCLAPLTKVLLNHFGIEEGLMTTTHAVTATQPTVDGPTKKDFRGGRSALLNIIPSSTGAAKAVGLCLPEIKGKLTGMAFRVPVADVSVVDLTVRLTKSTDYDTICAAMREASESSMKGILGYTEEPVVSSDFIGNPCSSIFDKNAGIGLSDQFFKLISWYDNEIGYSHRILDLILYMASKQ